MVRMTLSILVVAMLTACADMGHSYVVVRRPQSITPREFQSLITAARVWIYSVPSIPPPGPIYEVRFITPSKAQVWYGYPHSDSKDFIYLDRAGDAWHMAGAGTEHRLKT